MINKRLVFILLSFTALHFNTASFAFASDKQISECLFEAKKHPYLADLEQAQLKCKNKFPPKTAEMCLKISNVFQSGTTGDDVRWECLKDFNREIRTTVCEKIADKMTNSNLQARAWYYCLSEIRNTPSTSECISLSTKLYPADSLANIKSFCSRSF